MDLTKYINTEFPSIQIGDQISKVYKMLEKFESLPLCDDGRYLGVVTLDEFSQITKDDDDEFTLLNARLFKPQIISNQTPLEATRILQNSPLEFIPVIDDSEIYLGVWDVDSIRDYYLDSEAMRNEGASVTLEIEPRNYSLSEISQICENSSKKILGVDIHTQPENETLLVTIHLDDYGIGDTLASLERYGYNIYETIGYQDDDDKLKENYDVLMSYLDL